MRPSRLAQRMMASSDAPGESSVTERTSSPASRSALTVAKGMFSLASSFTTSPGLRIVGHSLPSRTPLRMRTAPAALPATLVDSFRAIELPSNLPPVGEAGSRPTISYLERRVCLTIFPESCGCDRANSSLELAVRSNRHSNVRCGVLVARLSNTPHATGKCRHFLTRQQSGKLLFLRGALPG